MTFLGGNVSASFHEQTCYLQMTVLSGNVQACFAVFAGLIFVIAIFQQPTHGIEMTSLACNDKRVFCPACQRNLCQRQLPPENAQHRDTLVLSCNIWWRCAIIVCFIFLSASFHKENHNIEMAMLSCNPQRRGAIIVGLIFVSTSFHQIACNTEMAL
ncbi:unnamed protein product [Symbiodinium microadriaticum]|nr:unnamed protein product [Symbiodinium microadriaticum]